MLVWKLPLPNVNNITSLCVTLILASSDSCTFVHVLFPTQNDLSPSFKENLSFKVNLRSTFSMLIPLPLCPWHLSLGLWCWLHTVGRWMMFVYDLTNEIWASSKVGICWVFCSLDLIASNTDMVTCWDISSWGIKLHLNEWNVIELNVTLFSKILFKLCFLDFIFKSNNAFYTRNCVFLPVDFMSDFCIDFFTLGSKTLEKSIASE